MSQRELARALRDSFTMFAIKAFKVVNPGLEPNATPSFSAISHKLAEVEAGRIRRLIINVPPRSGKSVIASIAFPAFVLGRDPTRRLICASYSGDLAAKLARDCRSLMQSRSYGVLFPGTIIAGKNTETELETSKGGFRYSTSVGGTLTGRGGNFIIIDDPMKPDEAMSSTARERVWEWFTGTVVSRVDNKAEDAIVLVMQRVHVDDLSGRLLEAGGWDHLAVPAIAESEQVLEIASRQTIVRRPGAVLDPDREPRPVLEQVRREIGSATFEAQYQQQPVPETGGLIQWSWFSTYDVAPQRGDHDAIIISWDTAMKDREVNDYSVGIVAMRKRNQHLYILDVIRERLDFPSLRRRIQQEATKNRGTVTLIEAAGSGIPLQQELQRTSTNIIGVPAIEEKAIRFQRATPKIEGGQVHLPARAPWLDAFKRELLSFPASANDDQVDALSQLINWGLDQTRFLPLQGKYRCS